MANTDFTGIEKEYIATRKKSQTMYLKARQFMAGGISHDSRHINPFPFYVERAEGAVKWDIDGNELIDLWSGHGSCVLGHSHPDVVAAVNESTWEHFKMAFWPGLIFALIEYPFLKEETNNFFVQNSPDYLPCR